MVPSVYVFQVAYLDDVHHGVTLGHTQLTCGLVCYLQPAQEVDRKDKERVHRGWMDAERGNTEKSQRKSVNSGVDGRERGGEEVEEQSD